MSQGHAGWSLPSWIAAIWGVGGVVVLLSQAIWRLTPLAVEPIEQGLLTETQSALYVSWAVLNLYAEGYRAFHRGFSPRVVVRAIHLANSPDIARILLAPAFCMSLFCATRRGLALAWGVLIAVMSVVVLMHWVPQPWRGIIDGGVVVGLLWGVLSVLWHFGRALTGHLPRVSSNLPVEVSPPLEHVS